MQINRRITRDIGAKGEEKKREQKIWRRFKGNLLRSAFQRFILGIGNSVTAFAARAYHAAPSEYISHERIMPLHQVVERARTLGRAALKASLKTRSHRFFSLVNRRRDFSARSRDLYYRRGNISFLSRQ